MGRQTRKRLAGTVVTVDCSRMNERGLFTARAEGETVWFKGGVPGTRQDVLIQRIEGHKLRGVITDRKPVDCVHFWDCGGCKLQHLPYSEQLRLKGEQILSALESLPWFCDQKSLPIHHTGRSLAYRNKMEVTFSELREGRALGMHQDASFGRVLHTPACQLPLRPMQTILEMAADWYLQTSVPGYNPYRHEGCLRYLVLRGSELEGKVLVCLVATEWREEMQTLVDSLKQLESVQGILFSRHDSVSDTVVYHTTQLLYGEEYLLESLGCYRFRISLPAFFQVNTRAAELLYDQIISVLSDAGALGGTLVDLYCGAGSIGLYLSSHFASVIGVEEVPEAVENAVLNAGLNGIDHARFLHSKVEKLSAEVLAEWGASVLILDPPRSGCHPRARAVIASLKVKTVIFVSCNPNILPENLREFLDAGYAIHDVRAVELFAQTPHLELIVALRLRE